MAKLIKALRWYFDINNAWYFRPITYLYLIAVFPILFPVWQAMVDTAEEGSNDYTDYIDRYWE